MIADNLQTEAAELGSCIPPVAHASQSITRLLLLLLLLLLCLLHLLCPLPPRTHLLRNLISAGCSFCTASAAASSITFAALSATCSVALASLPSGFLGLPQCGGYLSAACAPSFWGGGGAQHVHINTSRGLLGLYHMKELQGMGSWG